VTGWLDAEPATAVELSERDHHRRSSEGEVVVDVACVAVDWLDVAVADVAALPANAMHPVRPAIAATLSQAAARRVRRAGCGRFGRRAVGGMGRSWVSG
jgi:hypothetical protein